MADERSDLTMNRVVVQRQDTGDGGWLEVEASVDTDRERVSIELRELSTAPRTMPRTSVVGHQADVARDEPLPRRANLRIEVTVIAALASVTAALDHGDGRPLDHGDGRPLDHGDGRPLDGLMARFRGDGRAAIAWALGLPGATTRTRTQRIDG